MLKSEAGQISLDLTGPSKMDGFVEMKYPGGFFFLRLKVETGNVIENCHLEFSGGLFKSWLW